MTAIFALYRASLKEFTRDRLSLFWTLAFPILFIVIFGLIFSGSSSPPKYDVGFVNQDGASQYSQSFQQALQATGILTLHDGSKSDDMSALKNGKIDMVIIIPQGFSQNAQQSQSTPIQMYYDPSQQATAQIKVGIVSGVVSKYNQVAFINEVKALLSKQGSQTQQVSAPLSLNLFSIESTTLSAIDFLVPGILAMSLMQLGLFGTVLPLVSLRERKILRRLGATPLPRSALLFSQVLMRVTVAAFQALVILGIGAYAFGVHVANPLATAGIILLGTSSFIGLGYLLASVARTQDAANGLTQAINFPMLFLSGIFFPLADLPAFLTPIVRAIPVTYLADALRQTMINSPPSFPLTTDLLVLAGWTVVTGLLSIRLFKWE